MKTGGRPSASFGRLDSAPLEPLGSLNPTMRRRLKTLFGLVGAKVDEEWYLSQYPDVRAAVQAGRVKSASSHYRRSGYAKKCLPSKPVVDEAWYLQTYPDVAAAIREGRETSAYDHFVKHGYREGRTPTSADRAMPAMPADWEPSNAYGDFCVQRSSGKRR